MTAAARPFLKWAGGKAKLAPRIISRLPTRFGRYHEPFLGGGAVFFALASSRPGPASLSDANAALMDCYRLVRDQPDQLSAELQSLSQRHLALDEPGRRAHYYDVRATEPDDLVQRAARLIFLNRTGYNGLYRENAGGKFNVPFGRYKQPRILDRDNLLACSTALQAAELAVGSFECVLQRVQPGDAVYMDPPYVPLSATAHFTSYTRGGFGPGEQLALRDVIDALAGRGVAVLLSNSDHEAVRSLYAARHYSFEPVLMSRAINSNAASRAPIPELLIDNYRHPAVRSAFGDALPGS